jgi:hypothetical protein
MKDNNIENWNRLNRDKFDDMELPVGHRENFEKRLNSMINESKAKKNKFYWFRIAGSVLLFFSIISSVFLYSSKSTLGESTTSTSNEVSNFEEVENQYSSKIKEALVPVRSSKKYLSPEYRSFLKEMDKLDRENEKLKKLLEAFPNDERILNSIIENYKSRLTLLEQLKTIISNSNLNKNYDEKSL